MCRCFRNRKTRFPISVKKYALAQTVWAVAASRSPLVEDSCDLPGSAAASDPAEEAIFFRRMLELVE